MNSLVDSNMFTVQPAVAEILEALSRKARALLGNVLGTQPLVAFQSGGAGNFPYYYQDPNTTVFNALTYRWINNATASDVAPIRQMPGSMFSNEMLTALASVNYSLSKADQVKLSTAYSNAQNQQLAVLNAWKAAYGALPTPTKNQQPIDAVMAVICTTWASPPTTLNAVQASTNVRKLLNNAPASGQTIIPVVVAYLNALGDSISLSNAQSLNNAYVAMALDALQSPTAANGAMALNDGTTNNPAYMMNTALVDIINGLGAKSNCISITLDVSIASDSEYRVSMHGGASFSIPFGDFFSLGISGHADYFHQQIVQNASSVSVQLTFTGVTLVNYEPSAFNESTGQNWYWPAPILSAIHNAGQDISGYQFSPDPGIDFSANGPFGLLQGVAISNYPSVSITATTSDYESIQTTFQQEVNASLSFLGIPLGGGSESTYSNSASSDSTQSSVTITLNPPPALIAGQSVNSVGWVLGVQTNYPTVSADGS